MENTSGFLVEKVQRLPRSPGVYLFKDARGQVIYVGKAVDLRQRVRSYFLKPAYSSPRLKALVENIADLSWIVTDSEGEAFILESNLIKEHSPHYNVQFKDDKGYPYLRISTRDPYPRLEVARQVEAKDYRYFGPYSNAGAMRETMRLIKKIFPLRSCRQPLAYGLARGRPCLNYQIGRCLAPCRGNIPPEEYACTVEQVALFLEGRQGHLLKDLEKKMLQAAEELEFEKAARLRDQYFSLQKVMERQKVVSGDLADRDVIALETLAGSSSVGIFRVREGKLIGGEYFTPRGTEGAREGEIIKEFLRHFYLQATFIPREILLSHEPEEMDLIMTWLKEKRKGSVSLKVPRRGEKKALLDLVKKNTLIHLQHELEQLKEERQSLKELARVLGLAEIPTRIEGYDISHFAGQGTVGAMAVFHEGKPSTKDYRRFKIQKVASADDYGALAEVLRRRFNNEKIPLPGLILLDGGRGQLSTGMAVLGEKGLNIPMAALAKEQEHLFLPGEKAPLALPANHPALKLLQQVRDEAHRFALSLGRALTLKSSLSSFLEKVPGIGEVRRKALLKHFGSLEALQEASLGEICSVPAMNVPAAAALYRVLHGLPEEGERSEELDAGGERKGNQV